MGVRTALLLLGLAAGCAGTVSLLGGKGDALSYAQYGSLEKGMRVRTILHAFGEPVHRLEKDGRTVGLTYRCEDARGEITELRLGFSPGGRLQKWTLGGKGA